MDEAQQKRSLPIWLAKIEDIKNIKEFVRCLQIEKVVDEDDRRLLKKSKDRTALLTGILSQQLKFAKDAEKLENIIIQCLEQSGNAEIIENFRRETSMKIEVIPEGGKTVEQDISMSSGPTPSKKVKHNNGDNEIEEPEEAMDVDNSGPEFRKHLKYMDRLGQGGFGCVLKAVDSRTKHDYAVKIMKWDNENTKKNQYQIRELKILNQISMSTSGKKFVVGYVDFEILNNLDDIKTFLPEEWRTQTSHIRLYMECCQMSLLTWIKNTSKDEKYYKQAIIFFEQAVHGLNFLHTELNIIHRDLKPDNLLIVSNKETGEKSVKIGDFGLARDDEETKSFSQNLGTIWYMSPEQRESSDYGKKTDIYSLAKILVELLNPKNQSEERNAYRFRLDSKFEDVEFRLRFPFEGNLYCLMTEYEQEDRLEICELVELLQCNAQLKTEKMERISYKHNEEEKFDSARFLKSKPISSIMLTGEILNSLNLLTCLKLHQNTLTSVKLYNISMDTTFPEKICLPYLTQFVCDARINTDGISDNEDYDETKNFIEISESLIKSFMFFKKDETDKFKSLNDSPLLQCDIEVAYNNFTVLYIHHADKELRLPYVKYLDRKRLISLMEGLKSLYVLGLTLNPIWMPLTLQRLILLDFELNEEFLYSFQSSLTNLCMLEVLKIRFTSRISLEVHNFPTRLKMLCLGCIDLKNTEETSTRFSNVETLVCDDCDISSISNLETVGIVNPLTILIVRKCIFDPHLLIKQVYNVANALLIDVSEMPEQERSEIYQIVSTVTDKSLTNYKWLSLEEHNVRNLSKKAFENTIDEHFDEAYFVASQYSNNEADNPEDEEFEESSDDTDETETL